MTTLWGRDYYLPNLQNEEMKLKEVKQMNPKLQGW